jgi:hypothetical protein
VAVVGSIVDRSPSDLYRLIREFEDASFTVRFPAADPEYVKHVSDAEIALGSSVRGQGLWLNVLEKAFGQIVEDALLTGRGIREDAIDALGDGGSPAQTMEILTGRESRTLRFRPHDSTVVPSDERVAELLPTTYKVLATSVRERRLMSCVTPGIVTAPGIAASMKPPSWSTFGTPGATILSPAGSPACEPGTRSRRAISLSHCPIISGSSRP